MKSRIGLKPNGTLLFKKPEQHFEEQDLIKILDNWSKSIKDNPVADFTGKIKIKQIHVFPVYQLYTTRKYENRNLSQKREFADPFKYPRVPGRNWSAINAWDYNIAEKDQSQNIILEDTVFSENCNCCNATGYVISACRTCAGSGHVSEEQYKNGRTYYVDVRCNSCVGSGKQKDSCDVCAGHGGFVNYVICHVNYNYPDWGSKYAADSVVQIGNELSWTGEDFDFFKEVQSAKDFVNFVSGDIKEKSIADLISFINSNDSQNQHFLREKTVYGQTYVSFVRFEYEEGGDYTVVTYGEQGKVYAPDSPVSNCVDNLFSEAEQCIQHKDLESTIKILAHIYKMGQKVNIADKFVSTFFEDAGVALEKISHDKKHSEAKKIELKRAAFNLKARIQKSEQFSFKFEFISYFLLPIITSFAYLAYTHFNKTSMVSKLLIGQSANLFMAGAVTFAIQYAINRKKDLYFKKIWKYLMHGLAINFPAAYFLSSAKSVTEIIIGAIFVSAFQYFSTYLFVKFLDDNNKVFGHNLGGGTKPTHHTMEDFCKTFKDDLSDIKSNLKSDISYIDVESQSNFIKKARELENISNENSLDEEISYFKLDEKKVA